tara:strand:+ start:110 stop:298 length:189 start_codon:yes stop_codon:yes gene_type:complete
MRYQSELDRINKTNENKKSEKEIVDEYLRKLKVELAMANYSNGWYVKWVEDKIKEIESRNDY